MHRRPKNLVRRCGHFKCSNCGRMWESADVYCHMYTKEVWTWMKCYGCYSDKLCKAYFRDQKERRNPRRFLRMEPKPFHAAPPEECPGCGCGLGHCVCTAELERHVNKTTSYGRKLSKITSKAGQEWDNVRGGDKGCDVDDDEKDDNDADHRGEFHNNAHNQRRGHRSKGKYDVKPPVKMTTQKERKLPEMPKADYTMVDVGNDDSDDDEFFYDPYNFRKSHRSKGSLHYGDSTFF